MVKKPNNLANIYSEKLTSLSFPVICFTKEDQVFNYILVSVIVKIYPSCVYMIIAQLNLT